MNFKEWLYTTEMKKPYRDYMSRMFPDMPAPVRHELGTNTIVPGFKSMASNSPPDPYGKTTPSPKMSNPAQMTVGDEQQNKYSSPEEFLSKNEKVQKFKNADWEKKERIFDVHITNLDPRTQDAIKMYKFGYTNVNTKRHQQRMKDQEDLMKQRSAEEMDPIMLLKHPSGYELLEGWHRMFNYLLSGAPPQEASAIKNGELNAHQANYSQWKPVRIKAYIGIPHQRV